jgi:hypothetical protein
MYCRVKEFSSLIPDWSTQSTGLLYNRDPFALCSLIALMMEAARTSETSVDNYFTRQYIPEDKSELFLYTFLLSILLLKHECSYRLLTLIISCLYLYSNLISRASVSVFFFLALIFPLPKRWLNGDFVVPPICCVAFYKDLRKQLNCSKTYYYWPTEHKKSYTK